ncbi:pantoate--beta-alanine ligase [Hellea balneolensis]|uniref:pantoate--beta-alanine ligase n=1 Tax=Hellea balneolensis TaxID=287478 RepID=UPI00040A7090|nr:pantoate--beta-alanine ligase [Hellea balneolensis]
MAETINIIRSERGIRGQVWEYRGHGETTAFVPTMGALHDGHMSLIRLAKKKADRVIASIYVNPTQFAPGEDFDAYPRTEKHDVALLKAEGADVVYIPKPSSMYNVHHATKIKVGGVAEGLETDHRPTFFDGVALVVTKLLNRVAPDYAIFGEKDYQQLATIRRLVEDLDMPINIVGAKIARDEHGLALSSRNKYFDTEGLKVARRLNEIMRSCALQMSKGENVDLAVDRSKKALLAAGFSSVDYVEVRSPNSLTVLEGGVLNGPARLLVAAHCRGVRLIDNFPVKAKSK